ncbi:hypothetical protein GCM10010140_59190 [Streptosporangium pseudovulgare]|uniref:Uncharacterized protein n=1 Tax=Streptosporangium pseudovulgare TaxID=35765 RepID=A0ABQ2RBN2_9ACTN|nr:hypothetical protein GCM10010140_59190 [Streptosporangium pseudovulgare]
MAEREGTAGGPRGRDGRRPRAGRTGQKERRGQYRWLLLGSLTTVTKKSSMRRTTLMNWSKSTGLET